MRKFEYQQNKLVDLIPVMAYDPHSYLFFCEDEALGFSFLCHPMSGADDKASKRINVLLNIDFPKDTILQFNLFSSPDYESKLTSIADIRQNKATSLQASSIEQMLRFLRNGAYQPVERLTGTKVRDFQLVISVKIPMASKTMSDDKVLEKEIEKYSQLQKQMFASLKSADMYPIPVDDDMYLKIMRPILNWGDGASWKSIVRHESDFDQPINQQLFDFDNKIIVEKNGLEIGDPGAGNGRVVKIMTVKRLPRSIYFGQAINYLGDIASGNRGIKDSFMISMNIHYPDSEASKTKLASQKQWVANQAYGPMLKFVPELADRKKAFDDLFEAFHDGDRPVRACLSMALFGHDKEDAIRAASNARTYFQDLGITLIEDCYFSLPMFLNSLPLTVDRNAIRDINRYKTMATRHATPLLPVFADWKGTGSPLVQLISRNGQLMNLDIYDSSSSYNTCIIAQSGSGKSFLTNEIIKSYLSIGSQIWVIDVGRSYLKLCEAFEGEFIEFGDESNVCLNPFSIVKNFDDELEMLVSLLSAMAAPTETLTDLQSSKLGMILRRVWNKNHHETTIDMLVDELKNDGDSRMEDIGFQLLPFTSQGEYGKYFNGENNVKFRSQFNVLELEELKSKKRLQSVVLLQLVYQIQQEMYLGDKSVRKLAIIDEAWDLLGKSQTVADFLETGFRRFRKYNGAGIVITQSVLDLYGTPTGVAIAENSPNMLLLGQKASSIEEVKKDKRLPLENDGAYNLLKTVRTESGHYSEIFVLSDRGAGIGRLIVDPFRVLLYSTNPKDVYEIDEKKKLGMPVEDAIMAVLKDRGQLTYA